MKVLHHIATLEQAKQAEQVGVDAVITSGTEAGGHSGFAQLTTLIITPQVVGAVKIPVICGGGIGDGRGLLAALVLGAEAVYVGTRFMATKECPVHANWKQQLLSRQSIDTVAMKHERAHVEEALDIQGHLRFGSFRALLNDFSRELLRRAAEGKSWEEIMTYYVSEPPGYEGKGVTRLMASALYGDVLRVAWLQDR